MIFLKVVDIGTSEDFQRVFEQNKTSTKTLMIFRAHQPGVETLPEPIDWLDTPSQLREYSRP